MSQITKEIRMKMDPGHNIQKERVKKEQFLRNSKSRKLNFNNHLNKEYVR